MTRFEQIAAAFPLHAQRIAECVYEQRSANGLRIFMTAPCDEFDTKHGAGAVLQNAFLWGATGEGGQYWAALREGARLVPL